MLNHPSASTSVPLDFSTCVRRIALRGAAADVALLLDVGRDLANGRAWPVWNPDSEFRAVRETSAAQRR